MVGSETMNRGFRDAFQQTLNKVVLVPTCMRKQPDEDYQASHNDLDITCRGCTPDCHINRIRILGTKKGFDLYIVPHSSEFTRWLDIIFNKTEGPPTTTLN